MLKGRIQDLVIGVIAVAIGIFLFIQTKDFPGVTQLFSRIVLIIFLVIGAVLVLTSLINGKKPGPEEVHIKDFKNPMLIFLIILVYVIMIDKIGFFVASAVIMPALMLFMGYRKPIPMIATTIGTLGFIYFLFVTQLHVRLPADLLF
ncbi:MAG: tripartite tricarboxylate transporter TctB family protein [Lachnospiraceae bacterium]|nr:tripartite tricarboxylate transporter TctB family protein [Lachnospiraceae bacterium]